MINNGPTGTLSREKKEDTKLVFTLKIISNCAFHLFCLYRVRISSSPSWPHHDSSPKSIFLFMFITWRLTSVYKRRETHKCRSFCEFLYMHDVSMSLKFKPASIRRSGRHLTRQELAKVLYNNATKIVCKAFI